MTIVNDRNYQQILTAAVAKRQKKISDIVYNATPLTKILKTEGRIKTRSAGGPELRIPVEFAKLNAQWFTGYDKIEITPRELLNSARFNWSRVVGMFSLTGTELLYTRGEEEVIDLMEFYYNAAVKSVKEEFETSIVGDGTGSGGRQMVGLGAAIPITPNTGVYGGIDRAQVANWRTSTFDIPNGDVPGFTTWDSTTARDIIDWIALARSRNGRYAKLLIADSLAYRAVTNSIVAHQRIVSERIGKLGFSGLTFETAAGPVDFVAAGGINSVMPSNTIFGIDEEALAFYEFGGQNFVPFHPEGGMRPINQDAIAQGIVWSGQMVLDNPLFSYRIITA